MAEATEERSSYLEEFSRAEGSLPGSRLPWLRQARADAIARFGELGFPTLRQEAWRFTSVEAIARTLFKLEFIPQVPSPLGGEGEDEGSIAVKGSHPHPHPLPSREREFSDQRLEEFSIGVLQSFQLVFINGRYAPELSAIPHLENGIRAGSLAEFLDSHPSDLERHLARYADVRTQAFTALNTAFFADGAHVYLPRNAVLETPIHLLFLSTAAEGPVQTHPRVLIVAEPGAKAAIVETHAGEGNAVYWTNAVTEIVLAENTRLDHYKVERESLSAYHISTLQVRQARDSVFNSHAVLLGGALVRHNVNVVLADEGAECALNGLYMSGGRQHMDTHTLIDHAKPHGTSREYYKGILDGQSRAVFDGHVIVRPDAQKTDSIQTNKNLLLSGDAKVDTKPELRIFANDVKCKHGATIGQISPEALFYMRSRGIGQEEARRLLIYAFASEMIDRVEIPALRDVLRGMLFKNV